MDRAEIPPLRTGGSDAGRGALDRPGAPGSPAPTEMVFNILPVPDTQAQANDRPSLAIRESGTADWHPGDSRRGSLELDLSLWPEASISGARLQGAVNAIPPHAKKHITELKLIFCEKFSGFFPDLGAFPSLRILRIRHFKDKTIHVAAIGTLEKLVITDALALSDLHIPAPTILDLGHSSRLMHCYIYRHADEGKVYIHMAPSFIYRTRQGEPAVSFNEGHGYINCKHIGVWWADLQFEPRWKALILADLATIVDRADSESTSLTETSTVALAQENPQPMDSDSYFGIQTREDLRAMVSIDIALRRFLDVTAKGKNNYLFNDTHFGEMLSALCLQLEPGTRKVFLITSPCHALGITLECQAFQHLPPLYLLRFFDTNYTKTHLCRLESDIEAIKSWRLSDMMDEKHFRRYFPTQVIDDRNDMAAMTEIADGSRPPYPQERELHFFLSQGQQLHPCLLSYYLSIDFAQGFEAYGKHVALAIDAGNTVENMARKMVTAANLKASIVIYGASIFPYIVSAGHTECLCACVSLLFRLKNLRLLSARELMDLLSEGQPEGEGIVIHMWAKRDVEQLGKFFHHLLAACENDDSQDRVSAAMLLDFFLARREDRKFSLLEEALQNSRTELATELCKVNISIFRSPFFDSLFSWDEQTFDIYNDPLALTINQLEIVAEYLELPPLQRHPGRQ